MDIGGENALEELVVTYVHGTLGSPEAIGPHRSDVVKWGQGLHA